MPRQSDECFTPGEGTHQRYLRASKGLKFNTIKVVVGNPGRFMGRERKRATLLAAEADGDLRQGHNTKRTWPDVFKAKDVSYSLKARCGARKEDPSGSKFKGKP